MKHNAVILDFDGTICLLFGNYDLHGTSVRLREKLLAYGIDFSSDADPFDVFDTILIQISDSAMRETVLLEADAILTDAEREAVRECEIVPGFRDAIERLHEEGIPLGIVTNNSADCVRDVMKSLCLDVPIAVVGRVKGKPWLLKPNPWMLDRAMDLLGIGRDDVLFIGDALRDYDCAVRAGCYFLPMAPTSKKEERFRRALPDASIVHDFHELMDRLSDGSTDM